MPIESLTESPGHETTRSAPRGKQCRGCCRVKPFSAFGLDTRTKSRYKSRCNDCLAEARNRARGVGKTFPKFIENPKVSHLSPPAAGRVHLATRELVKSEREYGKAVAAGDTETAELLFDHAPALVEFVELTRQGREPSELWQLSKLGYIIRGATA